MERNLDSLPDLLHLDGKEEDELATAAEEAEEDFDAEVDAVAEELALGPPVVFELPADMCDDTVVTVTDDCVETSMDQKPVLHAIEMSMDPVLGTMKKAEEGEEEDVGYQREQSLLHLVSTCVGAALPTKGHVIERISVVHIGSVERLLPIWWLHLLSGQTDWLLSNNHHMRSTRRSRNTDTCSGCGCRGCHSGSGHLYTHSSRCWSTTTCTSPTLWLHWMDHCRCGWWWGQRRSMMILMRMVLLLLLVMMMRRMMLMNMMMVRLLMMIVVMVIIVKILICWRQWIAQIIIAASGRRPSIAAAVVAFDLVRDPVVTFLDLLEWFILSYDPGGDVQERVRLVLDALAGSRLQ
uniref:Uncharacterized protein n=1 Tax=Anopheles coluzzii TaxID=1518534 RepID=A0A8W7PR31_ANOCL